MKKYIMLGVNSKRNLCCELRCLLPFEKLIPSELEESDFSARATTLGGDDIDRTLRIIKMKQTGRKIMLDKPITFRGIDYDRWGQSLPWECDVDEIHELTPTASDK